MQKRIITFILSLILCLMVCSCNSDQPDTTMIWNEMPALTYGSLYSKELDITTWNNGRCEATSNYEFAETANGYYYLSGSILYYADKTDLSAWLPVCNNPGCSHSANMVSCNARMIRNTFLLQNGRIWFTGFVSEYPELYIGQGDPVAILSRSADGSDLRLEYVLKESVNIPGDKVSSGQILTPQHFIYGQTNMNPDGSYSGICYRVTNDCTSVLWEGNLPAESAAVRMLLYPFSGDKAFFCSLLGEDQRNVYFISENIPLERNTSSYIYEGRYLSGNMLRCFRANEGYYDVNLETGEECLVAQNQLENSGAVILLPNCIIESTLDYYANSLRTANTVHSMKLFDGEKWLDVMLPTELKNAGLNTFAVPFSVTSDNIFVRVTVGMHTCLYRIALGQDNPQLEYCGQI